MKRVTYVYNSLLPSFWNRFEAILVFGLECGGLVVFVFCLVILVTCLSSHRNKADGGDIFDGPTK